MSSDLQLAGTFFVLLLGLLATLVIAVFKGREYVWPWVVTEVAGAHSIGQLHRTDLFWIAVGTAHGIVSVILLTIAGSQV